MIQQRLAVTAGFLYSGRDELMVGGCAAHWWWAGLQSETEGKREKGERIHSQAKTKPQLHSTHQETENNNNTAARQVQ